MSVTNAGVGHLVSEYLTGLMVTLSKPGATHVYNNDLASGVWEGHRLDRDPAHGDLAWVEDFFR